MAALRRAGGDGLRWATGRGSRGVANPLKVPTVNHHLKLLNQGYVDSSVSNGGIAKNDRLAAQESLLLHAGSAEHDGVEANTVCRNWQPIPRYLFGPGGCL